MDYHTVYRNASPQSTEWEDIHRRLGNLPPVEDRPEAPPIHAALDASQIVKDQDWIGRHRGDEEELARLEDEGIVTDDRALENYRYVTEYSKNEQLNDYEAPGFLQFAPCGFILLSQPHGQFKTPRYPLNIRSQHIR